MNEWPARDKLITELRRSGTGHTGMVAADLVFAYTHELAEKIREHCRNSTDPCGCPGADLIDPEVP